MSLFDDLRESHPPQDGRKDVLTPVPKVLLVVGPKNNGKTTLIEKLIPELSTRGYRVGTVKHHHSKSAIQMDREGKDSWRHRRAGARAVAVISPSEVAVLQYTNEPTPLGEVIGLLGGIDVVLVEGFRSEPRPRIEVRLAPQGETSGFEEDTNLLALVSPEKCHGQIPCFTPDEIGPLADLIEQRLLVKTDRPAAPQQGSPK
jgi:molybdopterin-guanine dinucleotide biosynthesis protein B